MRVSIFVVAWCFLVPVRDCVSKTQLILTQQEIIDAGVEHFSVRIYVI